MTIDEFINENKNKVFRYLVYNKFSIFTPEEKEKKYIDQSIYEDTHYQFCRITDVINTPDGTLLELESCDSDYPYESFEYKTYKLLKDISLVYFDADNDLSNREYQTYDY